MGSCGGGEPYLFGVWMTILCMGFRGRAWSRLFGRILDTMVSFNLIDKLINNLSL